MSQPTDQPVVQQQVVAPQQVVVLQGPTQQQMSDNFLPQCTSLYVSQSKRGWLYEHFCFETESVFFIYTDASKATQVYTITETSNPIARCCCGTFRPFQSVLQTPDKATTYATYTRPLRAQAGSCCCQQEIQTSDGAGNGIGRSYIPFYLCIPTVNTEDAKGTQEFTAEMVCGCSRSGIPFEVKKGELKTGGMIKKEWGSLATECCTDADDFSVIFPPGATLNEKFNLIGSTLLMDYNFFESQNQ